MASLEVRGDAIRVTWLLGGRRGAAKQSCTFSGADAATRLEVAQRAKALVEARQHDIRREECYQQILGVPEAAVGAPTFKQWASQWIEQRRREGDVQENVLRHYENILNLRAVPFMGHKLVTDIDRATVKAWVRWMSGKAVTYGSKNRHDGDRVLAPQTVIKYFMVVSSCLGAAVPTWLAVNPAAPLPGERRNSVGLPRSGPSIDAVFLDPDEVAAILRQCPPDLYDIVFVALRTGMRMGELVALQARHVLFPRGGGATVLVRQALKSNGLVGVPKSPASRRDIPVKGEAAEILARRVAGKPPSGLVLTTERGARWCMQSLRTKHFYRAVAAAQRCPVHPPAAPVRTSGPQRKLRNDEVSTCGCPGLLVRRPRFHDLRHTHASVLINSGMPTLKVQRRLGHANYQTTMDIYGHLLDHGNDEELDGFEAWLAPKRHLVVVA